MLANISAPRCHACSRCYRSKTACNGARPCNRCERLGHGEDDTCSDRVLIRYGEAKGVSMEARANSKHHTPTLFQQQQQQQQQQHQQQTSSPPITSAITQQQKQLKHAQQLVELQEQHVQQHQQQQQVAHQQQAPFQYRSPDYRFPTPNGLISQPGGYLSSDPAGPTWGQPSPTPVGPTSYNLDSVICGTPAKITAVNHDGFVPDVPDLWETVQRPQPFGRSAASMVSAPTPGTPVDAVGSDLPVQQVIRFDLDDVTSGGVGVPITALALSASPPVHDLLVYESSSIIGNPGLGGIVSSERNGHTSIPDATPPTAIGVSEPPWKIAAARNDHLARALPRWGGDTNEVGQIVMRNHHILQTMGHFQQQLDRRETTPRRLQLYLSLLSESLSADEFAALVGQLTIPVPLSCRASYSLVNAAGSSKAHLPLHQQSAPHSSSGHVQSSGPSRSEIASSMTSDSEGPIAGPALVNTLTLPMPYIDYTWTASPLTCISDASTCGRLAPIAVMRVERLSPFLEDAASFVRRKCATHETMQTQKRQDRRAQAGQAAATAEVLKQFRVDHRKRKRERHARRQSSDGASDTATGRDPSKHQHRRRKDLDASDSDSSHCSSSARTPSPLREDPLLYGPCGPLSFPPPSKCHTNGCLCADSIMGVVDPSLTQPPSLQVVSVRSEVPFSIDAGSAGTVSIPAAAGVAGVGILPVSSVGGVEQVATTPPTPPNVHSSTSPAGSQTDTTSTAANRSRFNSSCTCPGMQSVSMAVEVNAEWERLFGITQSEFRQETIKEGSRSLLKHLRIDSIADSHRAKVQAIIEARTDYSVVLTIVNKWRGELLCLCTVHVCADETGTVLEYVYTWTPLPAPTAPPMRTFGPIQADRPTQYSRTILPDI